jgi:hypothetical protein
MYDIQNTEVSRIWCIASYDLDNEQIQPWSSQNFEGGFADEIWVLWYWNGGPGGVALRNARHPQRCGVRVSSVPPSAVGNGGRMVTTHRASEFQRQYQDGRTSPAFFGSHPLSAVPSPGAGNEASVGRTGFGGTLSQDEEWEIPPHLAGEGRFEYVRAFLRHQGRPLADLKWQA